MKIKKRQTPTALKNQNIHEDYGLSFGYLTRLRSLETQQKLGKKGKKEQT